MEYFIEFILEIAIEGSIEVGKNRKIPKYIRYPLIVIISLIYIAIIGLILIAGILSLKDDTAVGIILMLIGFLMLIVSIIKIRKVYCAYGYCFKKTNKKVYKRHRGISKRDLGDE